MTALWERAERLRSSVDRLGRAATASAQAHSARAERDGVVVEVDASGGVVMVEVEPGWQNTTPPEVLGRRVCSVLEEAWNSQLSTADTATETEMAQPRFATARERHTGLDLADLTERLEQLVGETDAVPGAPVPARTAASAHVSGNYDGRLALAVDPVWAAGAHSSEVSGELGTVLRSLTRPQDGDV